MKNIPRSQGYIMPAEWEPHEGTWLQWPHEDTYKDTQIRLESTWLAMTSALHEGEIVHIAVTDERGEEHLQHQAKHYGWDENRIDIHVIPSNDVWSRDNGPIFLVNQNGELAVTSWNFNGWGERYAYDKDCLVPANVAEVLSLPLFNAPITLEGGAIEVNGKGTLMATRSLIINPNRNPGMDQDQIETAMREYLGVDHINWLAGAPLAFTRGIGDITDFHIDGFARFVDQTTVLYTWTDDRSNALYPYLKQHLNDLQNATTESGSSLTLVPIPTAENVMFSTLNTSTRAPFETIPSLAIYANFYIANKVVLVPVYGDVNDARAKSIIAEHFPDQEIIGILALATAELGGMMHCVTQQQPLGMSTRREI